MILSRRRRLSRPASRQVLDFDFNPFHEHIIGSASDDSTIKIWGVPSDGLSENLTEPLVDLQGALIQRERERERERPPLSPYVFCWLCAGHGRKVTLLRFHPTANNILGSVSGDGAVKIWDIEKGGEVASMSVHNELIQELVWDYTGKLWATSSKDKIVRLGDPRQNVVASHITEAHQGSKSVKIAFLGDTGRFVLSTFDLQSLSPVEA